MAIVDEDKIPNVWTDEHEEQLAAAGRVSRAATASLILGVLSFICLGPLAAVPGLLFGLAGLANTGRRGRLGRGRAWLGLLLSAGCLALCAAVLVKPAWRARAEAEIAKLRDRIGDMAGQEGTPLERNERKAVAALKRLRAVQEMHKAKTGTYARSCGALVADDPGCTEIAASHTRRRPYHGYYFKSLSTRGSDFVDHNVDFVIIAVPAEHGSGGRRTFAIGPSGPVIGEDVGTDAPGNAEALADWPAAD